jgi:hypothetical protein
VRWTTYSPKPNLSALNKVLIEEFKGLDIFEVMDAAIRDGLM